MSPTRDRRSRDTATMSSTREVPAAPSHTCCTDSNVPGERTAAVLRAEGGRRQLCGRVRPEIGRRAPHP